MRQARLEAGLSLGQVARADISRTAIYFVETGKSRPSMETLTLIAERTGRPLDFFLLDSSSSDASAAGAVAEMERLNAIGDNAGAVAAGEAILRRKLPPDTEATIQHLLAFALLRLSQPIKARPLLAAARAYFERVGDQLMVAECLASESSAAGLLEEPQALPLAEAALAALSSCEVVPPLTRTRVLFVVANAHSLNQDWQAAADLFQQSIDAAEVVRDLRRLSMSYGGIALAYQELGQFALAARFSHQALAIHETLSDKRNLSVSENNLGLLLTRAGEFESARAHLDRALQLSEEYGFDGRGHVLTSIAELELAQSRLDEAEEAARVALAVSTSAGESLAVAEAHVWLGKVAEARGRTEVTDYEFAAALAAVDGAGFRTPRLRIHADYADVLERRGDLAGSIRHLKAA
ncbi:MAG TPA: tetratricopeptide repeat protein, partial [Patescibacteria group bacterium]|nr:tetratricopeptide repeat protein [Patescibacteria group bacterium]